MKYTELIYDCNTQEETVVERTYSATQLASRDEYELEKSKQAQANLARSNAQAKLAALGLTTDDLAALGL